MAVWRGRQSQRCRGFSLAPHPTGLTPHTWPLGCANLPWGLVQPPFLPTTATLSPPPTRGRNSCRRADGEGCEGACWKPDLENTGDQPGGQVKITWEVSPCGWDHANLLQHILRALGDHSQCWAAFDSPVGKHWVGNQYRSTLRYMVYKASLHAAACQTQHDIPPPGWELPWRGDDVF